MESERKAQVASFVSQADLDAIAPPAEPVPVEDEARAVRRQVVKTI